MPLPDALAAVRAELASMRVVPCDLAHERVRIGAAGVQRRAPPTAQDPGLTRVGLCPHSARAVQLSCAHTLARLTLDRAIALAAAAGLLAQDEAGRLRDAARRIDHAIHMTDWDRSRAEVRYALLVEQGGAQPEALRRQCDALGGRHRRLGAELAALHARVLACLDAARPDGARAGAQPSPVAPG